MAVPSESSAEAEVHRIQDVLHDVDGPPARLRQALLRLRLLGPLPVEVLRRTLVGKSVSSLGARAPDKDVKRLAQELDNIVQDTKTTHSGMAQRELPEHLDHLSSWASGWRCVEKQEKARPLAPLASSEFAVMPPAQDRRRTAPQRTPSLRRLSVLFFDVGRRAL